MDPIILLNLISLIAKCAPLASTVFGDAKTMVQSLFDGGVITKEQQDAYMAWADNHMRAVLSGQIPPEMQVDTAPVAPVAAAAPVPAPAPVEAPLVAVDPATATTEAATHYFGGSASELGQ